MIKKIHLVCSPDLTLLIQHSLEVEGYIVSGSHSTLYDFVEGIKANEVDSSSIVIIEGAAGLSIPVDPKEITAYMNEIRGYLKRTRLIVQLDSEQQDNVEFIRSLVNLGIHDLQFTTGYRSEDVMKWIREKKTTRDYYNILGKKSLLSFGRKQDADIPVQDDVPPSPAKPVESLTRPHPTGTSTATAAGKRTPSSSGGRGAVGQATRVPAPATRQPAPPLPDRNQPLRGREEPTSSSSNKTVPHTNVPLIIGVCGAGGEEDVGAAVLLIAASLAEAGWKPLVCSDDRPEISSLEEVAFDGEKDDPSATMFEYEGVTFYRRGYAWDMSELMASSFTHIILWLDIQLERKGLSSLELWWNSQYPLLIANGAMWKYELLKEKLNTLNPYERKRCRLILENGHQEVVNKLKKDYEDIHTLLIPSHDDPLYPDKPAVEWTMQLLSTQKKLLRKPVIMWGIIGVIIFVTIIVIFVGLSITPENHG